MGIFSRLRFLIGMLTVVAIVGLLLMYLSYSMSNIQSQTAKLEADAYAVRTDYGGILKKQYVAVGQAVNEGDKLFEISSPNLTQAIKSKRVSEDSLLFDITSNGNILLQANTAGTVRQINFTAGSIVEANVDIASIAVTGTQYVTAKYLLNAPDYARINRSNPIHVTLPDNSKFEAKVFDITLEQNGEQVYTVVKARFDKAAKIPPTFSTGTPVSTSWQLNSNNWQDTVIRSFESLIKPKSQV